MSKIKISLIQSKLAWEAPQTNRNNFEVKILSLESTDLIVLPEMFTTGFSMESKDLAEKMDGPSIQWMRKMAHQTKSVICGSLIIEENNQYYNRLIWMEPNGELQTYDKRHLFRMAEEDQHFKGGSQRLVTELKGWKICPLICYDLRFPVWSRNRYEIDQKKSVQAEYDLLIYVANWPAPRIEAWRKLLFARAIENQVYVAAVNRIGKDEKGIDYLGGSALIDPKGESLWEAKDEKEEIFTLTLDLKELEDFRLKFPVGMDADQFDLH